MYVESTPVDDLSYVDTQSTPVDAIQDDSSMCTLYAADYYKPAITPLLNKVIDDRSPLYMLFLTNGLGTFHSINMPTELCHNSNDVSKYKHHIYGRLENGLRAHLILCGIDLYIDVLLTPDIMTLLQGGHAFVNGEQKPLANSLSTPIMWSKVGECTRIYNLMKVFLGGATQNSGMKMLPLTPINMLEYTPEPYGFMRIYFTDTYRRQLALTKIKEFGFCTFSDITNNEHIGIDIGHRYQINMAGYNCIKKYNVYQMPSETGFSPIIHIIAHIDDVYRSPYDVGIYPPALKPPPKAGEPTKLTAPMVSELSIVNQPIMIHHFDIETETTRLATPDNPDDGYMIPLPGRSTDSIFMICGVFKWAADQDCFAAYCITRPKGLNLDRRIVFSDVPGYVGEIIEVDTERELLEAYIEILQRMRPDVYDGYNVGTYDMPFIYYALEKYSLLPQYFIATSGNKYNTTGGVCNIKIDPNSFDIKRMLTLRRVKVGAGMLADIELINVPGTISVDSMILAKRYIGNLENYKLSSVLKHLHVKDKVDLNPQHMFKIYKESVKQRKNADVSMHSTLANMNDVAYYCVNDAMSCMRIWVRRNIIFDMRQKAEISFVTLSNAFHNADSIKCTLMVCAFLEVGGYAMSHSVPACDKEKYPGGFVHDLTFSGLFLERPVSELDFASLYPSCMTAFNITPGMIIHTLAQKELCEQKYGKKLREIVFKTDVGMHKGWVVQHEGDKLKMGVYPHILQHLKARRGVFKKQFEALEAKCDRLVQLESRIKEGSDEVVSDADKADIENLDMLMVMKAIADATQGAIKLLMNTFYGASGSTLNKLFDIIVAGATTTHGVSVCKAAQALAEKLGYVIIYGDTDSMYVHAPHAAFRDVDERYARGEITRNQYWTEMCYINRRECDVLRDKVNELMLTIDPCGYLKMSHDAMGFMSIWLCKKKYMMLKQLYVIDPKTDTRADPKFDYSSFTEKQIELLFKIRGVEFIKRGHTQAFIDAGYSLMTDMFNASKIPEDMTKQITRLLLDGKSSKYLYNGMTRPMMMKEDLLYRCVVDHIHKLINSDWDVDSLVMIKTYRSDKNNIPVRRYVDRLRAIGYHTLPMSGDKVRYVFVNPSRIVDEYGNFIKLGVCDIMEPPDRVKELGLQINKTRYINGEFIGMYARFISHLFGTMLNDKSVDVGVTEDDETLTTVVADEDGLDTINGINTKRVLEYDGINDNVGDLNAVDDDDDEYNKETQKQLFELAKMEVGRIVEDITHYKQIRKQINIETHDKYRQDVAVAKDMCDKFSTYMKDIVTTYKQISPTIVKVMTHWSGITESKRVSDMDEYHKMSIAKFLDIIPRRKPGVVVNITANRWYNKYILMSTDDVINERNGMLILGNESLYIKRITSARARFMESVDATYALLIDVKSEYDYITLFNKGRDQLDVLYFVAQVTKVEMAMDTVVEVINEIHELIDYRTWLISEIKK